MKRATISAAILLTALGACGDDDAAATDAGSLDGGCTTELAVLCDGDDLVVRDSCSGSTTVVESCEGACYRGACVDCAPEAGVLCVDGDVRDVDSCANVGEVVEECDGPCRAGRCVGAECTPGASTTCVGDTVHSVDSCGNRENALAVCEDGCTDGACTGCTPNAFSVCYDGDIRNVDSCGVVGTVAEDCAETCQFDGSAITCVTGVTCTPNDAITCLLGDIHHVDSCGGVQSEIAEECPSGCDDTGCLACTPTPVGATCSDGNVHELLGGCPGTVPTVGAQLEACSNGCRTGECIPAGCVPAVGTVCSDGDVHLVDSCGAVDPAIEEACASDCDRGACTAGATDGGTATDGGGAVDGGARDGGSATDAGRSCACVPNLGGYPPVTCTVGAARCGGCLGYDDFCDDSASCTSLCPAEFTCEDGTVRLDGTLIETCSSGGGGLCGLVCAP